MAKYTHFTLPDRKLPAEKYRIAVDFASLLESGDTLSATFAVTAYKRTDGTDVSSTIIDGTPTKTDAKIKATIKAGTSGDDYEIQFSATTTQADVFIRRVLVQVRD